MATVARLLTAEQYAALPDDGRWTELVRGAIVEMTPPRPLHGRFCFRIAVALGRHLEGKELGQVYSNDTAIVTTRDPDSVRGADVCYISRERCPRDPAADEDFPAPPELVFEVLFPSDRWQDVSDKVAEYLSAGVVAVCVVDPDARSAQVFRADRAPETHREPAELAFDDVLPGFRLPLAKLFDPPRG